MNQVLCDGGLANRLNTLLTALVVKKYTQSAWGIAWPLNNWCGAPFEDLFESMLPVSQKSLSYFKSQQDRYWQVFHENQIGFEESRITYNKTIADIGGLCNLVRVHPRIVYFHHAIPSYITDEMLGEVIQDLRPVARVVNTVSEIVNQYGITSDTIGVHIRKTDFGAAVDENTLFDQIYGQSEKFFICSDSNEVLEKFAELKNCVSLPKPSMPKKLDEKGGWNSFVVDADGRNYPFNVDRDGESVYWALVDLLILSRTKIMMTSGSSFLNLARRMGRTRYGFEV